MPEAETLREGPPSAARRERFLARHRRGGAVRSTASSLVFTLAFVMLGLGILPGFNFAGTAPP